MEKAYRWALVGTGGISNRFLTGLRAAGGIAAAAVSRSLENAKAFCGKYNIPKAYDNYDAMLSDPDIDVVYIGTPHTTHRDLTVKALKAKKAVLCEKPSAINKRELVDMVNAARENNTFFMEAMWNRFSPSLSKVREWIRESQIGEIRMVQAAFGFDAPFKPLSRIYNMDLGGGSLLDAGVYPLSAISMVFGGLRPEELKSQLYFGETGADETAAIILSYGKNAVGFASSSIRTRLVNDLWIHGSVGKIYVPSFTWAHSADLLLDGRFNYHYEPDYVSNGYNYEAAEVHNCLSQARIESPVMPWEESLTIMETMDRVRAQWNYVYPSERPAFTSV